MLVFPERVLAGDVPNVDFLHLYGPGALWVLAGVYKLLGTSLAVERLFGLLQQAGLVLGVYLLRGAGAGGSGSPPRSCRSSSCSRRSA